jgi:hypothetical protein
LERDETGSEDAHVLQENIRIFDIRHVDCRDVLGSDPALSGETWPQKEGDAG